MKFKIENGMKSGKKGVGFDLVYRQSHEFNADDVPRAKVSAVTQLKRLADKAPEFAEVLKSDWEKGGPYTWVKKHITHNRLWYMSIELLNAEPPVTDGELMTDIPKFRTEYRSCPQCGEKDLREMINTISGKWECSNCDYYEET